MNPTIIVSIITASASICAVALTFILTKRAERKDLLYQRKLNHYQELLSSISDLAVDDENLEEANLKFAKSVNTIALVAPQNVISALMVFHKEISSSNVNKSQSSHDEKLIELLLEMRKSLGKSFKDNPKTFSFHLVSAKPRKQRLD